MAGPLSDEEFHQQALAGGASRHVSTREAPPSRGYMVGGARNVEDLPYPEVKRPVEQADLDLIRNHARALRDHYGDDANVYQGAWREGDQVVLDASEHIDNRVNATTAAKTRGERAVYDLGRERDIHTADVKRKARH